MKIRLRKLDKATDKAKTQFVELAKQLRRKRARFTTEFVSDGQVNTDTGNKIFGEAQRQNSLVKIPKRVTRKVPIERTKSGVFRMMERDIPKRTNSRAEKTENTDIYNLYRRGRASVVSGSLYPKNRVTMWNKGRKPVPNGPLGFKNEKQMLRSGEYFMRRAEGNGDVNKLYRVGSNGIDEPKNPARMMERRNKRTGKSSVNYRKRNR